MSFKLFAASQKLQENGRCFYDQHHTYEVVTIELSILSCIELKDLEIGRSLFSF